MASGGEGAEWWCGAQDGLPSRDVASGREKGYEPPETNKEKTNKQEDLVCIDAPVVWPGACGLRTINIIISSVPATCSLPFSHIAL